MGHHIEGELEELARENAVALEREGAGRMNDEFQQINEDHFHKVSLEEFLYYAKIEREYETRYGFGKLRRALNTVHLFPSKYTPQDGKTGKTAPLDSDMTSAEKKEEEIESGSTEIAAGSDWSNVIRASRNATYMSVFYLITTDILGPSSAPYAISQLGFVPGALLYVLLGIAAAYTGYLLWNMFLKLDSSQYPLRSFGDIVHRIYGKQVRLGVDLLQCVQLLCNVAVIILGNGQGLSEITKGHGCYSILILVWALAGMIVGQIKSLQRFGYLANLAIWMNLFVCFATMGIVAHSLPNYTAASGTSLSGVTSNPLPVITKAVISGSGGNFQNQLNAVMNIVYAYGGAMVFVEFMSEMRRPMDFIKGMAMAQTVIFTCYLLYGLFVYAYQGQYVVNPANQGVSNYGWQTALNIISLLSALIAAGMYGNVGIKVVYNTLIRKILRGPDINSQETRTLRAFGHSYDMPLVMIWWIPMVMIYWATAYVIASSIPNFSSLTGLVGAICILQFTYTFPPIMKFGLDFQMSAMKADGPFDPVSKQTNRIDTWRDLSRWTRAYKDRFILNTFHILMFLASLATAALGIYANIELLISAFSASTVTSFTCKSTVA